jgi:hypothetical protein
LHEGLDRQIVGLILGDALVQFLEHIVGISATHVIALREHLIATAYAHQPLPHLARMIGLLGTGPTHNSD